MQTLVEATLAQLTEKWRGKSDDRTLSLLTMRPPSASAVVKAFIEMHKVFGTTEDLVKDFTAVLSTGLLHDDAVLTVNEGRKRSVVDEAVALFGAFDPNGLSPESIISECAFALLFPTFGRCSAATELQVLSRVFDACRGDTLQTFLKRATTRVMSAAAQSDPSDANGDAVSRFLRNLGCIFDRVTAASAQSADAAATAEVLALAEKTKLDLADRELTIVARRWKVAGVPDPKVAALLSRPIDTSNVLSAFADLQNAVGTTDDLLADFGTIASTGLLHDDADFVVKPLSGIARLVMRKDDRKRTIAEEAIATFCRFDPERRSETIGQCAFALLFPAFGKCAASTELQVLSRVFDACTVEVRAALLKRVAARVLTDAEGSPESKIDVAARHLGSICVLFDRFVRASKPQAPDDAPELARVVATLTQLLYFAVNGGALIRNQPALLKIVREGVFPCLLRATVHPAAPVHSWGISVFVALVGAARERTAVEIESFFHGAIFPVLQSRLATVQHKICVVEALRNFCSEAQHLIDFFINYDCDTERRSIFDGLWERVVDITLNETDSSLRQVALGCVVVTAVAINQWMDRFEGNTTLAETPDVSLGTSPSLSSTPPPPSTPQAPQEPGNFAAGILLKKTIEQAVELFNVGEINRCRTTLGEAGATPAAFATFLVSHNQQLSKAVIGEFFSKPKPERVDTLKAYVAEHDFRGHSLDEALRSFLGGFKLVGEAQVVDRTMEIFASHYCDQNPSAFRSASTAFVLSFSLCMLNTDAHSVNVTDKMTLDAFISNNRGIDDGGDVPKDVLAGMYSRIAADEIKLRCGPADRPHLPDAAPSAPFLSGLPLLRHLAPVVSLVTDAVLLPIEIASSLTGYTDAVEKRRTGERFLKEFSSIVYDTVTAMKFLSPQSHHAFVMANSLQHVVPMLHSCAESMVKALCSGLCRETDVEFDAALKGARNAVQACCRIGHTSQTLPVFDQLVSISKVLYDAGSSEALPEYRSGKALRALYDMCVHNGDTLPQAVWALVYSTHAKITNASLFKDSPATQHQPDVAKTSSWFRKHDEDSKSVKQRQLGKGREVVRGTITAALVTKLFDGTMYAPTTRVAMVRALSDTMTSLRRGGEPCCLLNELTELLVESSTTSTRLQWFQMWNAAAPVYVAMGTSGAQSEMEFAVSSLEQLACAFLQREEMGHFNHQQDVMKPLELIFLSSNALPVREMVIGAVARLLDTRASLLCSGWRVVFNSLSHSANFEATVDSSWGLLRGAIDRYTKLIHSGQLTSECVQCLIAFVCNPWSREVAFDAVTYVKEWCASSDDKEVTLAWSALLSFAVSAVDRDSELRCATINVLLDSIATRAPAQPTLLAHAVECLRPLLQRLPSMPTASRDVIAACVYWGALRCSSADTKLADVTIEAIKAVLISPDGAGLRWEAPVLAMRAMLLSVADGSVAVRIALRDRCQQNSGDVAAIALSPEQLERLCVTVFAGSHRSVGSAGSAESAESLLLLRGALVDVAACVAKVPVLQQSAKVKESVDAAVSALQGATSTRSAQSAKLLGPLTVVGGAVGAVESMFESVLEIAVAGLDGPPRVAAAHAAALVEVLQELLQQERGHIARRFLLGNFDRLPSTREIAAWNEAALRSERWPGCELEVCRAVAYSEVAQTVLQTP